MSILISHETALDFWRKAYPTNRMPSPLHCVVPNSDIFSAEEDAWVYAPSAITSSILRAEGGVLHLMVQNKSNRRRSTSHYCHIWNKPFPIGSFYKLDENAYLSSPEFVFLQLARHLSLSQTIALGNELCGLYSFDSDAKFGIRQREIALSSIERLSLFLEQLLSDTMAARNNCSHAMPSSDHPIHGCNQSRNNHDSFECNYTCKKRSCTHASESTEQIGDEDRKPTDTAYAASDFTCSGGPAIRLPEGFHKAKQALKYMVNRSGSPMETLGEMYLSLPYRLGGYSFLEPEMNAEIQLTSKARAIAHKATVRADMYWENQHFVLEYLGEEPHSANERMLSDRARTNALQHMGFTVKEITWQQISSIEQFEIFALDIAKILGKRIPKKNRGATPSRVSLRNELNDWNRAFGRAGKR